MKLDDDHAWSVDEVSAFLRIPVHTLYQWRSRGIGPKAARVGRHLRYLPDDVIDWFRQQHEIA